MSFHMSLPVIRCCQHAIGKSYGLNSCAVQPHLSAHLDGASADVADKGTARLGSSSVAAVGTVWCLTAWLFCTAVCGMVD